VRNRRFGLVLTAVERPYQSLLPIPANSAAAPPPFSWRGILPPCATPQAGTSNSFLIPGLVSLKKGARMKQLIAILLCIIFPISAFAGDNSYRIAYDGGSIAGFKAGTDMKLFLDGSKVRVLQGKTEVAVIPAAAITEISYGQDVHRRVGAAIGLAVFSLGLGALLALSKSKKHFIGLTWDDNGVKGGFAFQADKNDYRGLLTGLEGVTGKKAVDSEAMTVKN
jgi:hypothetical protein